MPGVGPVAPWVGRMLELVGVRRAMRPMHRTRMKRRRLAEGEDEPEAAEGGKDAARQAMAHRPNYSSLQDGRVNQRLSQATFSAVGAVMGAVPFHPERRPGHS